MFSDVDHNSVLGKRNLIFQKLPISTIIVNVCSTFAGFTIYPWPHRTCELHHSFDNQLPGLVVRHSHGVKMASRTGGAEAITRPGQPSATADTTAKCTKSR